MKLLIDKQPKQIHHGKYMNDLTSWLINKLSICLYISATGPPAGSPVVPPNPGSSVDTSNEPLPPG